ncbi:transglycosylase domain-containing protein [Chitinophaga filiformis]|uniref:transglycosylase domain-containing protein n=1 Tax=Chitinophaga filiformis TaxID=104663 RepID=UPI001F1AB5D2|nr:transglycosylase domain-containing protein [Chitinophaga filiformis]MCF6403129.1 transglycosylase domain-containing protein [Chitinophaga filiformis]
MKSTKMRNSVKILWFTALGGMVFFILMLLLINFGIIGNIMSLEDLENPGSVKASEIIAEDDTVVGKYYKSNRSYSSYDSISKNLVNGLIAMDDVRFYNHTGIERGHIMDFPLYLLIGKTKHGSGSITLQLARRLLVNNGGADIATNAIQLSFQKMQEWLLTVKLERHFTKQEIIALHLNTALFGDTIYGIENAAHTFFSRDAGHLSLAEAATLVGMLKGGKLYNPLRNPNISLMRRNVVIDQMERREFITEKEAEDARSQPITLRYNKIDCNQGPASYFSDVLQEELTDWCKEHKKVDGSAYNLYEDGLKIYTSINPRMQMYANETVTPLLQGVQKRPNQQSSIKTNSLWYKWPQLGDIDDTIIVPIDFMPKPFYIIRIEDRYGNKVR